MRDDLELFQREFYLEGETVYRKNGRPIKPRENRKSYAQVSLEVDGRKCTFRLHRVKFALAHGYLPPTVDHRSRDGKDDSLGNLRPATKRQNSYNRINPQQGVRRLRSGRWQVYLNDHGRQRVYGTYTCYGHARLVANATRRHLHGEFHATAD